MTAPCRFAPTCLHNGVVLVHIHGIGDRRVCADHLQWMTDHAMDFRRLDDDVFVPTWRQYDLKRDESGRYPS